MNEVERLSLNDAVTHVLEECRTIVPGMQALFGFQLIAVFSQRFDEKLTVGEQQLHVFAIVLVVLALAMVMAPAALHRQSEPQSVSQRFIMVSTNLLLWSMPPLAVAISLDVYLIARAVFTGHAVPAAMAVTILLVLCLLWFVLPRSRKLQRLAGDAGPARPNGD